MYVLYLLPSILWHCWLVNRKGIQPIKSLASKPLGIAVNVTGRDTARFTVGNPNLPTSKRRVWKVLDPSHLDAQDKNDRKLRIKGQPANPGLPGKWCVHVCVCVCMFCIKSIHFRDRDVRFWRVVTFLTETCRWICWFQKANCFDFYQKIMKAKPEKLIFMILQTARFPLFDAVVLCILS